MMWRKKRGPPGHLIRSTANYSSSGKTPHLAYVNAVKAPTKYLAPQATNRSISRFSRNEGEGGVVLGCNPRLAAVLYGSTCRGYCWS